MTKRLFLVADIGGTHARFALAAVTGAEIEVGPVSLWLTATHDSLESALHAFLDQEGAPKLDGAAVCAAGPVEGTGPDARIAMTNTPWKLTAGDIAAACGVGEALLVNDFTAVALAVPALGDGDFRQVGGGTPGPASLSGPVGVLGPGTGLGVSSLVPASGDHVVLPGEGGHVDLAPGNDREISVLFQLMQEFGHVSAERVLSGPGLEVLYRALASLDGAALGALPTAMDIARRARTGDDPLSSETVFLFCGWLGAVAGDLALTLGATGGIYLAGGILPRWGGLFDEARFRHRFEAKGRFHSYMARIPTYLITRDDPALLGLAREASRRTAS